MMKSLWVTSLLAITGVALGAEEVVLPIRNGGFEHKLEDWNIEEPTPMCSLSTEQAATGQYSLKVVDKHPKHGSAGKATAVSISGAGVYELRGMVYPVWGSGLGMYVRVLDKDRKLVVPGDTFQRGLGGKDRQWLPFSLPIYTSKDAAYLELWIHSYSMALVEAYLDDLHFVSLGAEGMKPPWEGTYKIRPHEKDKLTAADVVGPDGIVYPNWTRCGVEGDIPNVPAVARIEDFGGKADDDLDDHVALDKACAAAGEKGGGAVTLAAGTYYLDRPVTVSHSRVVIRGQGADKTKIIFRYKLPDNGVGFYWPPANSRVGKGTNITLHCQPTGLMKMTVFADEVAIHHWERSAHSGNTFGTSVPWSGRGKMFKQLSDGPHTLKGVAEYKDGSTRTGSIPVVLDSKFDDRRPVAATNAAISFIGKRYAGPRIKLAQDGKRGATTLALAKTDGLAAGDCITIDGPATPRWKKLTKNACKWGSYRRYQVRIKKVDGNTITIGQPLRIEFPKIDGSYVHKTEPITRCGVEDLYIEQTEDLWISSVVFYSAWNCWARGVTVKMCGRFPVYGSSAKFCTIRDCVFDDAWFKGGGGTAYAGWDHCWDCLMENTETFKLRHGPCYQWASSGNVVRKSVFHDSDGQWHAGWTNENLFEQCTITSQRGTGSYGFGMWASPPEDAAHGPNGPRNVVYNCDVTSQKTGLWMGGMNENWLILHNRFVVDNGQGVFAKTASFDHIIQGNVFVLKDGRSPMAYLATPDCIGVEIKGNELYGGGGNIVAGLGKPAVNEGNEALPLADAPRPAPAVPSIYEWQQARK